MYVVVKRTDLLRGDRPRALGAHGDMSVNGHTIARRVHRSR